MSDYISKSALIEQLKLYENELYQDKKDAVWSEDEMMEFAIMNQETAIYRIKRCIEHELPTVNEKEIISKPMERIIERLEKEKHSTLPTFDEDGYCNDDSWEVVDLDIAIEIVKEVGGIE